MNRNFLLVVLLLICSIFLSNTALAGGANDLPFASSLESFASALSGKVGVAIGTISLFVAGITFALSQGELSSLMKSVIFILIGVSIALFANTILQNFLPGSSGNLIVFQDCMFSTFTLHI